MFQHKKQGAHKAHARVHSGYQTQNEPLPFVLSYLRDSSDWFLKTDLTVNRTLFVKTLFLQLLDFPPYA